MTIAKAIARAWNDDAYKAKLMSNPRGALSEAGVSIPAGITVKIVENTADTQHVVLPVVPPSSDLNRYFVTVWGNEEAYKAKLISDPHAALSEAGVFIPPRITVKVVENTADTQHVVLPVAPAETGDLSIDELEKVVAGINATSTLVSWHYECKTP